MFSNYSPILLKILSNNNLKDSLKKEPVLEKNINFKTKQDFYRIVRKTYIRYFLIFPSHKRIILTT